MTTVVETPPSADGAAPALTLPELGIGGRAGAGWREEVLARAEQLSTLARLLRLRSTLPAGEQEALVRGIGRHLEAAHDAASHRGTLRSALTGGDVTRAARNINGAEVDLLRLAPDDYLRGQLPAIRAYVSGLLPRRHPERVRLEEIAGAVAKETALMPADREQVITAYRSASDEDRRTVARLRSFRNVLVASAGLLAAGAVGVMAVGWIDPDALVVCFTPDGQAVCPTQSVPLGRDPDAAINIAATGWDLSVVCIVGMLAAGISATASLRRIRGTSTPYSLPVALAVLKIPTGALTAVLGLLLMRGQFVPGLSNLDSPGQIIAWAVVFGGAQQLFTRLVDRQAQTVLDNVGGKRAPATTAANDTEP